MNDIIPSWTVPVVTDSMYHVMFGTGIDFDNMGIIPKYKWKSTDKGVVFRFNNTKTRDFYDSKIYYGSKVAKTLTSVRKTIGLSKDRNLKDTTAGIQSNPAGQLSFAATAGPAETLDFSAFDLAKMDYDNDTQRLDIFLSGNENCTTFSVNPAPCRTNCPDPTKDCA